MYPNNDRKRLSACRTAFHSTARAPCTATALSARAKPESESVQHALTVCLVIALD